MHTHYINCSFAIGEAAGGAIRKINSIGQVISLGQGLNVVVVAIVHQGITKYKQAWNLGLRRRAAVVEAHESQCNHGPSRHPYPNSITLHLYMYPKKMEYMCDEEKEIDMLI